MVWIPGVKLRCLYICFACIVFVSAHSRVNFKLNQHATRAAVISALFGIGYASHWGTDTARGLKLGASLFTVPKGDRPLATNVVVMLTDGGATDYDGNPTNVNKIYQQRAEELKALGILSTLIPRTLILECSRHGSSRMGGGELGIYTGFGVPWHTKGGGVVGAGTPKRGFLGAGTAKKKGF